MVLFSWAHPGFTKEPKLINQLKVDLKNLVSFKPPPHKQELVLGLGSLALLAADDGGISATSQTIFPIPSSHLNP